MNNSNLYWFRKGLNNGIPIALGYLAVSFTLGIAAKNAELTAFQGALASITCHASAGEFAGFTCIAALSTYAEIAIMELIINARYFLMSCSLSQKLDSGMKFFHRLIMGLFVTDEIFGLTVSVPEKLNPFYMYGIAAIASPGWVIGTYLGVLFGNILPVSVVSALSVGLYGMFIAIIIPPSRKNKVIAGLVAVSMTLSCIVSYAPVVRNIASGTRIIILTVVISLTAAILFPVKESRS
ncbi:MAG: AzlC family ABC transporter permease [Eubacteriales bacterium]|nr:AzlC family ABC transporter permease [Eubacteriales bacterium]